MQGTYDLPPAREITNLVNAVAQSARQIAEAMGSGKKVHFTNTTIYTSLLSRFPDSIDTNDIGGAYGRALDLQELVAIWLNEYTDVGISAYFERQTANGERYVGLLELENRLREKVSSGVKQYMDIHNGPQEAHIPGLLEGFVNDAVLLSKERRSPELSRAEYLDLDSAIHEVAFMGAVSPKILQGTRIPYKLNCSNVSELKRKYGLFLSDEPGMQDLNEYQRNALYLHSLSMLLKIQDDGIDGMSENTDGRLGLVSYGGMSEAERAATSKRYMDILSHSPTLRIFAPVLIWGFDNATSLMIKAPGKVPTADAGYYKAAETVNRTRYTSKLRHTLLFDGSLERLFPMDRNSLA